MKTELFISWRYLLTRRKEKFISIISIISVLGVAIGVAALIVVIGVMAGFDKDLRDKIVGNYSHLTVVSYNGITNDALEKISATIKANAHVRGVSPYVQGQSLIKEGERFFAVGIKGVEPATEPSVTKITQYLIEGRINHLTGTSVILGKELALRLGLGIGSTVTLFSPQGKQQEFVVVGIFHSGMYDYDMNLVFMNMRQVQQFLEMGPVVSAVAVQLDDLYQADKVKQELAVALGFDFSVRSWIEANKNFFSALQLEKIAMFIILTLIVLVAAFNIVSTLIVMVVEKTKDIGILRSLGMSSSAIRRIFTLVGLSIGLSGTIAGAGGGMLLCGLLKKYQFIKLPQDIYYIDRLPVLIQAWPDVMVIVGAAMVITLISTIYPAHKAASLKPVEALRYE
ncbi:MAG: ABC transporter permease [Candidatus Omnitrophica bacterium]|nr:ABC transporter permease [Candidatus Omnitrophota bacterium]